MDNNSSDKTVIREMGLTRDEFFRNLPRALHGYQHETDDNEVIVMTDEGPIKISIGVEKLRQIGLLKIPYTEIKFDFSGIDRETQDKFLRQFNLYYQKGGG